MTYPTIRQEIDKPALEAGKDRGVVMLIDLEDGQEVVKFRRRYRSYDALKSAIAGAREAAQ